MIHRVALATDDGLFVNKHFRQASEFHVVDVGEETYSFVEQRKVSATVSNGKHDAGSFEEVRTTLSDCEAVFVAKIGSSASQYLAQSGIRAFEVPGEIDRILRKVIERKVLDRFGLGGHPGNRDGRNKLKNLHPCFGAVRTKARMHLPICPGCNIECGFCRRSLNSEGNRPGVASFILSVEEVGGYVDAAVKKVDALSVVGVAGPGDSLVGDNMFNAFRIVKRDHPKLLTCISTNGLLLDERADELIALGIDSLTVTVNAVDANVLSKIVLAINYGEKRFEGTEAAEILIRNQLAGIRKMARAGVTIKINTVLIPEINGDHIPEIAKTVRNAGAAIYNLIPLIPQHRFADFAAPDCAQIDAARSLAAKYIDVFHHCQHCRADAVGIPGVTDYSSELFKDRAEEVFSHG
jgi:nitrogen fixation protein NifB